MEPKSRILLLAAAALALPIAASAQDAPAPRPAAPPQPAEAEAPAAEEVARIRQRLAGLQERAGQDPAVREARAAFDADVQAAMEGLDEAAPGKAARAQAIQAEAEAARAAGDNERLNRLAEEAQELQRYFSELQTRVLAIPEISEKRQAFVTLLFAKMTELDPEAPALVQRLEGAPAPAEEADDPRR